MSHHSLAATADGLSWVDLGRDPERIETTKSNTIWFQHNDKNFREANFNRFAWKMEEKLVWQKKRTQWMIIPRWQTFTVSSDDSNSFANLAKVWVDR